MKKKRKKEGKPLLSYMWPPNLSKSLAEIDISLGIGDYLFAYALYFVISAVFGTMFRLQLPFLIAFMLSGVACVPVIMYFWYENKYEAHKFAEEQVYMEQVLNAFDETHKVVNALEDVAVQFSDGRFRKLLDRAVNYIYSTTENEVEAEALRMIEKEHDSQRIRSIHAFMLKAENIGGDFTDTIKLLNDDRDAYETRVLELQAQKKQRKVLVLASILVSVGLCVIFTALLPRMMPTGLNIQHNIVVQIGTVLLWAIDCMMYALACKNLGGSWTRERKENNRAMLDRYEKVKNYDFKAAKAQSIKLTIGFAVATVIVLILGWKWVAFILAALTLLMPFQHRADYSLAKKALEEEVMLAFPKWLMDVSMRLQTNSVEVALQDSYEDAPEILKPELEIMYQEIMEAPSESEPYIGLFRFLNIPSIISSMQMLYSVAVGNGGDADAQIKKIIEKNNKMVDQAERAASERSLASLYGLFLMPSLSGGFKLAIDMVIFFFVAMGNVGVFI